MQIIGGRPYTFTPEGESEARTGWTIHAVEPFEKGKGVGMQPVKLSFSTSKYNELLAPLGGVDALVGQYVEVWYNRWGKVDALEVLEKGK